MVDVPNPICCIFFYQRQVGLHAYSLTLLKWCKSEWSCWSGPWCRDHCRHTGHVRCQPSWANAEQLLPTSFLHSSSSSSSTQSSSSSASSSSAAAASSASSGTTVVTPTRWIWTVRHCTGPRQVWGRCRVGPAHGISAVGRCHCDQLRQYIGTTSHQSILSRRGGARRLALEIQQWCI